MADRRSDLLQRRRGVFGDKTTTANSTVVPMKRRKLNWNISFKFLVINCDSKLSLCPAGTKHRSQVIGRCFTNAESIQDIHKS